MSKLTATGTSAQGFDFEDVCLDRLISISQGKEATLHQQQTECIDYIDGQGNKYDIKYQPKAWAYGTVNVELYEYNPNDESDYQDSWLFTSTAQGYIWNTGEHLLAMPKELLYDIGYAYYKAPIHEKMKAIRDYGKQGFSVVSNGTAAQQMSSDFKLTNSSRRTQARTLRVPIEWLLDNGAIDLYEATDDFSDIAKQFPKQPK